MFQSYILSKSFVPLPCTDFCISTVSDEGSSRHREEKKEKSEDCEFPINSSTPDVVLLRDDILS